MERGSSFDGRDPEAGKDDRARVTNVLSQFLQGVLELLQTCWEVRGALKMAEWQQVVAGATALGLEEQLQQPWWWKQEPCSRGGEQKGSPWRTQGRGKAFAMCSGMKS